MSTNVLDFPVTAAGNRDSEDCNVTGSCKNYDDSSGEGPSSRDLILQLRGDLKGYENRGDERHQANLKVQEKTAEAMDQIQKRLTELEKWQQRFLGGGLVIGFISLKDLILWFLEKH